MKCIVYYYSIVLVLLTLNKLATLQVFENRLFNYILKYILTTLVNLTGYLQKINN